MGTSARRAPRALPWHRAAWFETLQFLLLMGLLLWFAVQGAQGMGYEWKWDRVPRYLYRVIDGELIWGPLMKGAFVTLDIAWKAGLLALVFGLGAALLRMSRSIVGPALAAASITAFCASVRITVPSGELGPTALMV